MVLENMFGIKIKFMKFFMLMENKMEMVFIKKMVKLLKEFGLMENLRILILLIFLLIKIMKIKFIYLKILVMN